MVLKADKFKTGWLHLMKDSCCILTWRVASHVGGICESGKWAGAEEAGEKELTHFLTTHSADN